MFFFFLGGEYFTNHFPPPGGLLVFVSPSIYLHSTNCSIWTPGRNSTAAAGESVCFPCGPPTPDTPVRTCPQRRTYLRVGKKLKRVKQKQENFGGPQNAGVYRFGSCRCCPISVRWTFAGRLCTVSTLATSPQTCFASRRTPIRTCTGPRWARALEQRIRGPSI